MSAAVDQHIKQIMYIGTYPFTPVKWALSLNPRIDIVNNMMVSIAPPIPARLADSAGYIDYMRDQVRRLEDLNDHAQAQMPRDVAVERPSTRVVLVPLQNDVTPSDN